jgi:GNAT superfamily N-acetyltransferase
MSETFVLRCAEAEDATAIRQLTREAYSKWVAVIGREPKPMTADYEAAVRTHRFDLLMLGDTLAGLVETVDLGHALLIKNLAVSPGFQRRGLGTRLMSHAEGLARALGRDRIELYTNKRFCGNVELYLRLGYTILREEDLGGGTVRVDMGKAI